jgi:Lsr2
VAEQIVKRLIDDIDGGEAAETVPFSIDGTSYEIDLSGENAQILRVRLSLYVQHARKTGTIDRRRGHTTSSREHSADIRAWAKARGIMVNERGRIPATVIEQYENAH